MDATGGLTDSGSLPEFLKNSAKKVGINLLDAQEILFSSNGEAVYILDGTGRIAFLGRSRLPLKLLPGDIWDFSIARGFVLSPDEKGFYLLDGHGVVHPFGETKIPVKSNNSAWSPDDEARALCLDASGNGLYLANRKGEIFAIGHPTDPVSKEIWPQMRTEIGEELVQMAYDPAGGQFWILTNKGKNRAHSFWFAGSQVPHSKCK